MFVAIQKDTTCFDGIFLDSIYLHHQSFIDATKIKNRLIG